MRKAILLFLWAISFLSLKAQNAHELIRLVQQSQQRLKFASYSLVRKDTLVTGHIREIRGEAKLESMPADKHYGFRFWGARKGINSETIYDGTSILLINHDNKNYSITADPVMIPHMLGNPGGQVILTDLVRIDTSGATGFDVQQDATYYYLTMSLADIVKYDVTRRTKKFIIDKKLMLPVGTISRQETLGKVQDINYRIEKIETGESAARFDFSANRIPDVYVKDVSEPNKKLFGLKDKVLPAFQLADFNGNNVSSASFKGKVVLLDFWEVWCGPCVESLPKIQDWHSKYRAKGLEVFGIVHETQYLASAKQLVQKKKVQFPMLQGNDLTRTSFNIQGVPVYILIDRNGKIVMVSEGFTPQLEEEIQRIL